MLLPDAVGQHLPKRLLEVRVSAGPRHRPQLPVVQGCATVTDPGLRKRPLGESTERPGLGPTRVGALERGGHRWRPGDQVGGIPHLSGEVREIGIHPVGGPGSRFRPRGDGSAQRDAAAKSYQGSAGKSRHHAPDVGAQEISSDESEEQQQRRSRSQDGVDGDRQGAEPVRGVGEPSRKENQSPAAHHERRQPTHPHGLPVASGQGDVSAEYRVTLFTGC